jgi:hypothetical protein
MTTNTDSNTIALDYYLEPTSSFIDFIGYNWYDQKLYVSMHGHVYVYSNVPTGAYRDFEAAESAGHYYHKFAANYGPAEVLPNGVEVIAHGNTLDSNDEPSTGYVVPEDLDPNVKESPAADDYSDYPARYAREWALSRATELYAETGAGAQSTVDAARVFEDYIKNG